MINSNEFRGKAGIIGSGRSIYIASVFILNVGLARSLGTEMFGNFQQVFMFSAVFMILMLGIPETMFYFLPRLTSEERTRFLGQSLMFLALAGGLIVIVFWFGAPIFANKIQGNPSIEPLFRMFGIYGAFLVASSFADPVFITFQKIRYLFVLSVVHGLFFIVLTGWQYVTKSSVHTLFTAMAVFGIFKYFLAVILLFSMRAKTGKISFFRGKSTLLLQLSFSLPIALSITIEIISRFLDKFVVSIFFGPETLGIYYVGALEIPLISVVVSSVYNVVSPVLNSLHHKNDLEGFTDLIRKTFKFISKIIWPIFSYLFVFADHLIPLVFKPEYMEAVKPFKIYLLLMPLRIALYSVIVLSIGLPRAVFWSAFVSLAMNFILSIVLAIHVGFLGPAIATVVSSYFHVGVLLYIIKKGLNIRLENLIPFNSLFTVAITCGFAVLLTYALTINFSDDFTAIVSSLPIFTGAYLFLGSKAGFIRIADIRKVLGGR